MADTCSSLPAPDICPTRDEVLAQILVSGPTGRAWGNADGGPFKGPRLGFWTAIADVLAWVNGRICKAREEFFCATADEQLDVWNEQYGLPDGCDPFPDLCVKVAAQGSQRCDYFQSVAARSGWAIDCVSAWEACGARAGSARAGSSAPYVAPNRPLAGHMRAGRRLGCPEQKKAYPAARAGATTAATLTIVVFLNSSPSYAPPTSVAPQAGGLRAGQRLGCATNSLEPLECLIERITPAHAQIIYRTV